MHRNFWALVGVLVWGTALVDAGWRYDMRDSGTPGPRVAVVGLATDSPQAIRAAMAQVQNLELRRGARLLITPTLGPQADVLAQRSAQSLGDLLDQYRVDHLLILTEDYDDHRDIPTAMGRTLAFNQAPNSASKPEMSQHEISELATVMRGALGRSVAGSSDPWSLVATSKALSRWLTSEGVALDRVNLITVTTSTKNVRKLQVLSRRARQMRIAAFTLFDQMGMLNATARVDRLLPGRSTDEPLRVAIYDGPGAVSSSGHGPLWLAQSISHLDMRVAMVGPEDVRRGVLREFDVVVFGGGSARGQADGLGSAGRTAVVEFVTEGGGFVGICAGAFLALDRPERLGFLEAKTTGKSGSGVVPLSLKAGASKHLSPSDATPPTKLSGGPSFIVDSLAQNCEVWATYADDLAREGKELLELKGHAAVVAVEHGAGRVVAFGPHCERYPGPQDLFWHSLRWAGKRDARATAVDARKYPSPVVAGIKLAAHPNAHGHTHGDAHTHGDPHTHTHSHAHDHARPPAKDTILWQGRYPDRVAWIRALLNDPTRPEVLIIAHRGHHLTQPENSIASLEETIAIGAHIAEVDIRSTRDRVNILLHDRTIDRTTWEKGPIREKTLHEISHYELCHGIRPTGQRMPTLEEALLHVRGRLMLNPDIKENNLREVVLEVQRAGMLDHCLFKQRWSSMSEKDRAWVQSVPGLIFMPMADSWEEVQDVLAAGDFPAIELLFRSGDWKPTDAARLAELKARGVRPWLNTLGYGWGGGQFGDRGAITRPNEVFREVSRLGISMIQTDLPELAMDALYKKEGATVAPPNLNRHPRGIDDHTHPTPDEGHQHERHDR